MMDMEKTEFIRCPICGNKTRDKVREDTILKKAASSIVRKKGSCKTRSQAAGCSMA